MTKYISINTGEGIEIINNFSNKISISRYVKIPISIFIENPKFSFTWSVYSTSRGYGHYNSTTRLASPSIGYFSFDLRLNQGEILATAVCDYSDANPCIITIDNSVLHIDVEALKPDQYGDPPKRPNGYVYVLILKDTHSKDKFGIRCLDEKGNVVFHSSDYYPKIVYSGAIEYLNTGKWTSWYTDLYGGVKGAKREYNPYGYNFYTPTVFSMAYIKDLYTGEIKKVGVSEFSREISNIPFDNLPDGRKYATIYSFQSCGLIKTWTWGWKRGKTKWGGDEKELFRTPNKFAYIPVHDKKPAFTLIQLSNGIRGSGISHTSAYDDNYTSKIILNNYIPCKMLMYQVLDVTDYVSQNTPITLTASDRIKSPYI